MVASISDNCTPVNLMTYSLTPNTFTCDDIGLQNVQVIATDLEGNSSVCITTIDIQDNLSSCGPSLVNISGRLLNVRGNPVSNMEVVVNDMFFTTTDATGFYAVDNLPAGQDYVLTVTDTPVERFGISTFDLVLIAAHVLQTRPLTDPYRIIAFAN